MERDAGAGKCTVCGATVFFTSPVGVTLREATCPSCGATRRNRDVAASVLRLCTKGEGSSLKEALPLLAALKIYEPQSMGPIHDIIKSLPGYVCSEFLDNIAPGMTGPHGTRCENLEALTFPDGSFDLVITQDVIEHVADPDRAFGEIHRILRPGGRHIFTIPLHEGHMTTIRAKVEHGTLVHILPPVHHGDPLRIDGCLVFTDFGDDLPEHLSALGIPTRVAMRSEFYHPSSIPFIDTAEEHGKYIIHKKAGSLLKYFLYNSVVFVSEKAALLERMVSLSGEDYCKRGGKDNMKTIFSRKSLRAYENFLTAKHESMTGENIVRSTPYNVFIDVCSFCNLQCPFCATGEENFARESVHAMLRFREKAQMEPELFDFIIDEIGQDIFFLHLYNWGEPLLNKNLIGYIKKAKAFDAHITIHTNLSLKLEERGLEDLLKSGIDTVAVSIDGFSQESYGKYRRRGDFGLVKRNITDLAAMRDRLGLRTEIIWNFLVFSFNEHEINATAEYCKNIGIVFQKREATFEEVDYPEWVPSHRKKGGPAATAVKKEKAAPSDLSSIDSQTLRAIRMEELRKKPICTLQTPCEWHYSRTAINANGTVSPCCAITYEEYDYGRIVPGETAFRDIWNNAYYRKSRAHYTPMKAKGLENLFAVCERCWLPVSVRRMAIDEKDAVIAESYIRHHSHKDTALGKAFALLKDKERFRAYYSACHAGGGAVINCANPADAQALSRLIAEGEGHFCKAEYAQALASFKALSISHPASHEAWNNLGVVLFQQGEVGEAKDCFMRALSLMPGYPEAEANLKRLP